MATRASHERAESVTKAGKNGAVDAPNPETARAVPVRGQAAGWTDVAEYVHSLGLDAYLVGGAVRDELLGLPAKDEDFVVPGVGHTQLRAALEPHGRVEDLEVAGQLVGVRLHPRDREARALQPGGIEFAPPRTERSTGPGRHDFVIAADASVPLEADMQRRDFTVNAMARSIATNELVDPLGGASDLQQRILRTVSATSFRDDPLRIVRGLRLVSQLGLEPDPGTLAQMREHAGLVSVVSGERIGGGLQADAAGELSKLLLGPQPARALRLARDTGVLSHLVPEFEPSIGFDTGSERQTEPVDEHIFSVVQHTADAGDPLAVRLAALLHDLGKPESIARGTDHADVGAGIAGDVLRRFRYPTRLVSRVVGIVRNHSFTLEETVDARRARRFLAGHGEGLAFDLVALKEADLAAKDVAQEERDSLARFRELLEQERTSPHRIGDLEVGGADLIALGYREGPQLGRVLAELLAAVVDDPSLNTREILLERARQELGRA
jgi:tRNA nucleotidyltransferase (CCA-adding enzyme)